jgi:hypothetical protein
VARGRVRGACHHARTSIDRSTGRPRRFVTASFSSDLHVSSCYHQLIPVVGSSSFYSTAVT